MDMIKTDFRSSESSGLPPVVAVRFQQFMFEEELQGREQVGPSSCTMRCLLRN